MTEAIGEPRRTQMSVRDRHRVYVAMAIGAFLLFAGGAFAYVVDFRHQRVCPGGKQWLAQSRDDMGAVTYICPSGTTVTQGMIP
jgi:hypothetical protein